MRIELKSNRRFIAYAFLPFITVAFVLAVVGGILGLVGKNGWTDTAFGFFMYGIVFGGIFTIFVSVVLLWPGKRFIFTETEIKIYKRKKLLTCIAVENISEMKYRPWKRPTFSEILDTLFMGSTGGINGGNQNGLHLMITEESSAWHKLGFLGHMDVKRLKKLYSELLRIEDF